MEKDLRGKVAVVTGGARGIGYAIADNFLKKGAKVIIVDNNSQGEESTKILNSKYDNRAEFIKCDITTDLNSVSTEIFSKYIYVDVLVNNAAIVNETSARKTMETNALGTIEWSVKFYEKMRVDKGGKGGTIMNMSSVYGFTIDPYLTYYKASKFAVYGFSKSLGHVENYNRSQVRVIALCPGLTYTTMMKNVEAWDEHKAELNKMIDESAGLTPDEVGNIIVEVFEKGTSGTAWLIAAGQPLMEV